MDRTAEAGKSKGGGVCFMTNKNGVTPRISPLCRDPARLIWNIYPLFAAHSIYHPASSPRSSLLPFTSHHRQTRAWLCLNFTMWSAATLTNILTLLLSSRGILTKQPQQVMPNFHQHVSCPTRGPNTLIIATLSLRTPTRPVHYLPLVSLTTPPSSSHRNTNKGSHRNPRWRGKWRVGPPTLKLCCSRLLMTSTGHVQGELIWRQRVHGGGSELCKHTYRTSYRNNNCKVLP